MNSCNKNNDNNDKYNLIWKNIIIKKEVSNEYADKCIDVFNRDKRVYICKEKCTNNKNNTIDKKNLLISLNFIQEVLKVNGLDD
jgi:hypothetical protein